MTQPVLEAIKASKTFGENRALDEVSLSVSPGEIYCLLGANGAGKTTLINLFLDFLEPSSGEVRICGRAVAEHSTASKREVAYIPETVTLYGVLSGLENLRYFAALATGEARPRAELLELLGRAGLDVDAADRRVATYSKGMRQKVGIAIALAKRARALLLDEPTSGLDPQAAHEFALLIQKASHEGVAVLTTTHDLFHAKHTGTRIGIMKRGRLIDSLRSEDLSLADLQSIYLQHMSA